MLYKTATTLNVLVTLVLVIAQLTAYAVYVALIGYRMRPETQTMFIAHVALILPYVGNFVRWPRAPVLRLLVCVVNHAIGFVIVSLFVISDIRMYREQMPLEIIYGVIPVAIVWLAHLHIACFQTLAGYLCPEENPPESNRKLPSS